MNKKEQFDAIKHLGTKVNRQRRREEYLRNPKYCLHCGKVIELPENKQPNEIRSKKFCNRSCAASYNNLGKDRHESSRKTQKKDRTIAEPFGKCEGCGTQVAYKQDLHGSRHIKKKYCSDCLAIVKADTARKAVHKRIQNKGLVDWSSINEMTKQEVLEKSGGHVWTMKATITRYARLTYKRSGRPQVCKACGYDKHINVSHIKDVKDFSMDSLVGEINDIDNLVALCPTHHWEFDHGLLSI